MSGFVNEGKLVDIIHLKLSRSLSTVSDKKLESKLRKCRLEGWTTKCMESKLHCWTQRWWSIIPRLTKELHVRDIPRG